MKGSIDQLDEAGGRCNCGAAPDQAFDISSGSVTMSQARVRFGREREQRLLNGHLAASMAGRGRLVLVGGSAGIGKTTLVAELASDAMSHGIFVLTGACYDLTTAPPYGLWRDLATGYQPDADRPPVPCALTDE